MSEYWVSNKKYYCTYCKIYIADDAPSRQQHENGLRHQGNKERFVRGLYKTSEKRKHDLEEEKREMMRIDQAAQVAFAQDVGSGLVKPGSGSRPTTTTSPIPVQKPTGIKPPKSSNPWANYTTAASLGYTDPDEERMKAEAERRRTQGVAGDWEAVDQSASTESDDKTNITSLPLKKREAEEPLDPEDTRSFKLRKKIAPSVTDDLEVDLIPVKLKPRKVEVMPEPDEEVGKDQKPSQSTGAAPVKWTSRGWKRPEDEPDEIPGSSTLKDDEVKTLEPVAMPEPVATASEPEVKEEPEAPPAETVGGTGPVFRKRKLGGNRAKR